MSAPLNPSPPPSGIESKTVTLNPSFFEALRGIWLLTWRSQFILRKMPALLATLLALPLLIWITVRTPDSWKGRESSILGNSWNNFNQFQRRMSRGNALSPEASNQLLQIFNEEYEEANKQLRAVDSPETNPDTQRQITQTCYDNILRRAKPLLDDRQYTRFQSFTGELTNRANNRAEEPAWNRTAPFYHLLIDLYFFIILPLSCVRGCGGLIRDELQFDTLGFLTTRPISRANLLIAKFLTQVLWLEIISLVEGLLLFLAADLRQVHALGPLLVLFLGVQFLAVLAWSALGIFLGQVTKRYLPLALIYGLVVELGIGNIPTNINSLSLLRHMKALLAHNAVLQGIFDWTDKGLLLPIGALSLAVVLFVGLAATLFTFREYHSTTEMQK